MAEPSKSSLQCSQCGKPAVIMLGGQPICIPCEYKFQQSRWMVFAQAAALMNTAQNDLSAILGDTHTPYQVPIPPAPIPPFHYNNQAVTVNSGTVGVVNFGNNVHEIQVNVQALMQHGDVGVAEAMTSFTNAILAANEVAEAEKKELLERVAFLASQAWAPPAERKSGMIKTVISAMKEGAAAVSSVADAWAAVEPLLAKHFGF